MRHQTNVLVIGAGMGGLCAAARLAAAGQKPLLVDRAPEVGGRASSFVKDGYVINTGAVAIELGGAMQETFEQVGAPLDLRCPEPANVFRVKGKTINPAKGGWAFLLDKMTRQGAKVLTQLGSARKGEMPEEQLTLEGWIKGATSNQTVHRLFRNLAAAIFAVNADEIPAKAFLTYFMQKGAFRRFGFHPQGTVGVCRALAGVVEREGGEVWLESEVVRIHTDDGSVTGATVRRGGEEVEVTCGAVISNVGPVATIDLVGEDALDPEYVRAIRQTARPTANIIIHVASDEPLLDTPGLIVFSATDRICNAGNMTATCPELAPEGKHLTVVYAVPRPAIGDFDSDREVALALAELGEELPGMERAEILDVRVMRGDWPAQRAAAGYELPREVPLDGLWNVGDGVRDYGSGGTQSCAETARDVVEEMLGVPGMTERVSLDLVEGVADMHLVAGERHNAIDPAWVDQFVDAVARCAGARAVLIRADGPSFTVGGDLGHFAGEVDRLADALGEMVGPFHDALRRLGELPVPVVCAVQGAAAGGGLGLLWCADEVLIAPEAKIACGFARIALSGDGGSSWALPRLVGLRRAQQLLMGGRVLSAQEAVEWGIVSEVVPAAELEQRARARAAHYAAGPTVAYGHMRRLLRASWSDQLLAERDAMTACGRTADAREGITSFVGKRAPRFGGA